MGIRFLCPNGHKLNVKSFLAGKRAICPKCGARVVVPNEDGTVEPSTAETAETEIREDESLGEAILEGRPPIVAAASPVAATAVSQAADDPLEESPGAVWYVRPASGGQYGPASGEIMRDWIGDGRVAADSLVWRDGWPEWRSAAAVFSQLSHQLVAPQRGQTPPVAGAAAPPLAAPVQAARPVAVSAEADLESASPGSKTLADVARRRRRKNDVSLIASAILVFVSVILVIVLVLVFRSQGGGDDVENAPPAVDAGGSSV